MMYIVIVITGLIAAFVASVRQARQARQAAGALPVKIQDPAPATDPATAAGSIDIPVIDPDPVIIDRPGPMKPIAGLYADIMQATHTIIGGKSGAGKSVTINGIIYGILQQSPARAQMILCDPKKVELKRYRSMPHVLKYADTIDDIISALKYAEQLMDRRYHEMQADDVTKYAGAQIYVIIDEYADMVLQAGKQTDKIMRRLMCLGRAAGIHCIIATQSPLREIISTPIKCNAALIVALKTLTKQDSRNLIGQTGCEQLPDRGKAYLYGKADLQIVDVPMIDVDSRQAIIDYWKECY